jgi:hypothetical protein
LYTFGYAKGKIVKIKKYQEDRRIIETAVFEEGRLIKVDYPIYQFNETHEYEGNTILMKRNVENNTHLAIEYVYDSGKITEAHAYRQDGNKNVSIYYNYLNGNIKNSSQHYHSIGGIQKEEKGDYDESINPWSQYFMPGYEFTYSKNNEKLDYIDYIYDEHGRLTATILNGLETLFHYR